jgi:hypothetical protein
VVDEGTASWVGRMSEVTESQAVAVGPAVESIEEIKWESVRVAVFEVVDRRNRGAILRCRWCNRETPV